MEQTESKPKGILTESEAVTFAQGGSSETVEVRGRMTSARILSDLIAAFAHHLGGSIIFGYHARRGKVVGCNRTRIQRRYEEARNELGGDHLSSIQFYTVHGRVMAVVHVPKQVIPTRPVVRFETTIRLLTRAQLAALMGRTRSDTAPEIFGAMLVILMEKLRRTELRLAEADSWRRKVRDGIIGAAISALLAYFAGLLRLPHLLP